MRLEFKLLVLVLSFLITSCTGFKYQIKKNRIYTNKVVSDILKETDNVFSLSTEYSNASFVWTYNNESVRIYKLISSKVANFTVHKDLSDKDWIKQITEESVSAEAFKCAELDGDLLNVFIKQGTNTKEHSFAVGLDCLSQEKFQSVFLTSLSENIRKYHIKL